MNALLNVVWFLFVLGTGGLLFLYLRRQDYYRGEQCFRAGMVTCIYVLVLTLSWAVKESLLS